MNRIINEDEKKINLFKIESSKEIINTDFCRYNIRELRNTLSITKKDFDACYLKVTCNFAEYVQGLPDVDNEHYNKFRGLFELALDRTVAVMKISRGYTLPFGSNAETCAKEKDLWSFAVFAASLLQDIYKVACKYRVVVFDDNNEYGEWCPLFGESMSIDSDFNYRFTIAKEERFIECGAINLMLARQMLSSSALLLLGKNIGVFRSWLQYIAGRGGPNNQIYWLINKVSSPFRNGGLNEKPQENKNVQDITCDVFAEFIEWLRSSIDNKKLAINETNSLVFNVQEGIFLIIPGICQCFFDENDMSKEFIVSQNVEDFNKYLIDKLINKNEFIFSKITNSYIHEYYIGKWSEQKIIRGLLLKPTSLFQNSRKFKITNKLTIRPKL